MGVDQKLEQRLTPMAQKVQELDENVVKHESRLDASAEALVLESLAGPHSFLERNHVKQS